MASVWNTSTSEINDVLNYDIHTYYQDPITGLIYLTSDIVDANSNTTCGGLAGLELGATSASNTNINFDNVIISGLTSAYKAPLSEVSVGSNGMFQGYWFDKAIPLVNDTGVESYFEIGKEAAVFVANPLVSFDGEIFYRFKQWKVYIKENADYIKYSETETSNLGDDAYSAICRFAPNYSGHFLVLPVYEKVYSISLAIEVLNGSINTGGSISIESSSPSVTIDKDNLEKELYFAEFIEQVYKNGNKEEYGYYSNIVTQPFLYFIFVPIAL